MAIRSDHDRATHGLARHELHDWPVVALIDDSLTAKAEPHALRFQDLCQTHQQVAAGNHRHPVAESVAKAPSVNHIQQPPPSRAGLKPVEPVAQPLHGHTELGERGRSIRPERHCGARQPQLLRLFEHEAPMADPLQAHRRRKPTDARTDHSRLGLELIFFHVAIVTGAGRFCPGQGSNAKDGDSPQVDLPTDRSAKPGFHRFDTHPVPA
jgi:hypothetical protein